MIREKREKEAKKIKVQLLKIIIISIDVIGIFIGVIKYCHSCRHYNHLPPRAGGEDQKNGNGNEGEASEAGEIKIQMIEIKAQKEIF